MSAGKGKHDVRNSTARSARPYLIFFLAIAILAAILIYTRSHTMKKIVVFETSMGNFEVELDEEKAPISSKNFIGYVNSGFYNGLIFHRVISDFMIQGGGFDSSMNQKQTGASIKNEAGNGLKNLKYTLAMARTGVVDSATSQFFINVKDNNFLDHQDNSPEGYGYAVFGQVVSGFEVVEKIKNVQTRSFKGYDDVPVTPVTIKRAYVK